MTLKGGVYLCSYGGPREGAVSYERGAPVWIQGQTGQIGYFAVTLQGYLAHKKHPPARTLQWDYTWGSMVVLEGGGGFL